MLSFLDSSRHHKPLLSIEQRLLMIKIGLTTSTWHMHDWDIIFVPKQSIKSEIKQGTFSKLRDDFNHDGSMNMCVCLSKEGNPYPVCSFRPFPRIWTHVTNSFARSDKVKIPFQNNGRGGGVSRGWCCCCALPTERRCHVTAGVAKQANTSSVVLKCVRWGLATAWPRHWPHIRTCPLWVLAADVWLVWQAATSTILGKKQNMEWFHKI